MTGKVQKLTEALYRVTNLFSDKEPLKWQLRETAVEIFDLLLSILETGQNEQKSILLENSLRKINHLLNLTPFSGAFIANVNFDILKREYITLAEEIGKNQPLKEISPPKDLLVISAISNGHNGQSNGHNGQKEKNEKIEENKDKNEQTILLNERKKQVLSFIKPNEWKTIKEIAVSLPEIGEKSIQRDLLEMAEAGVIKKKGNKRWRKYSLI